jgi:hypothetical protein
MNRRGFFEPHRRRRGRAAIALPELELLVPKRTIFLPPAGGWIGRNNQLLTVKMIAEEALRILENESRNERIDRDYDREFSEVFD